MMLRLNLKKLIIRNFRSFGDYDTVVQLDNLGPILIEGQVVDKNSSNGSGKSSLADAIIWTLFDRVPSKDHPGDNIINFQTGKNCIVKLETTDGYTITRTRNYEGHNDLLLHGPNGLDISDSTSQNVQKHLRKLFGLDYDIFMSSTFFGQFGRPFLELSDIKRKKALERLLGLSRFDHYVEVAKEKITTIENEQAKYTGKREQIEENILQISRQIEKRNDESIDFEHKREFRIDEQTQKFNQIDQQCNAAIINFRSELETATKELGMIQTYDFTKLEKQWNQFNHEINKIEVTLSSFKGLEHNIHNLKTEKTTLTSTTDNLEELIRQNDAIRKTPSRKIDLEVIIQEWKLYRMHTIQVQTAQENINTKQTELAKLNSQMEMIRQNLKDWVQRIGTTCPVCLQPISSNHVHTQESPLYEKVTQFESAARHKMNDIQKHKLELDQFRQSLTEPTMSLEEAKLIILQNQERDQTLTSIQQMLTKAQQARTEREKRIQDLTREMGELRETIDKGLIKTELAKQNLEIHRPKITMAEAQLIKEQYDAKQRTIISLESSIANINGRREEMKQNVRQTIQQIKEEENPYQKIITSLSSEIQQLRERKEEIDAHIHQYNTLISHFTYLKNVYSDRKKIKAYILAKLIPYFNERIQYYLSALNCDNYTIEFNSFLQTKSDKWPYELWSGGERRRIDLAIMFAAYDLHTSVYEQQCNVLVFDEVDGRLDSAGVQAFVDILFKEFAKPIDGKLRTILVISHKDEMRDAFPSKIMVRKQDDFSYIEEIRS